ncbi:MAG: DUF4263 domain-containing protein [Desulfurivibrionaceae bacterium]
MNNLKAQISKYSSERPIAFDKIAIALAQASLLADDEAFPIVVELAQMDEIYDDYFAAPAMASLPGWGEKGILQLLNFAFGENNKNRTRSRAFEVLLAVSRGIVPQSKHIKFLGSPWDDCKKYEISKEEANFCLYSLRENLLIAFGDEYKRSDILFILGLMAQFSGTGMGGEKEDLDHFLSLIIDNQLILNLTTIRNFEELIERGPDHEEEIQKYLTQHPVLLDPFVNELYTKQELGSDFITDYVVKRINNQYVLVEIENSTDKLFLQNGNISSHLTTAIAQVRDFQAWVSDNLSYAQKKLPGIKHPEGLVVIGRRNELTEIELKRLAEENYSRRGHIKIVTYDDLLETAKIVYKNIIEKPSVYTTKDTKSI